MSIPNNLVTISEATVGSSVIFKPSEFISAFVGYAPATGALSTTAHYPVVIINTVSSNVSMIASSETASDLTSAPSQVATSATGYGSGGITTALGMAAGIGGGKVIAKNNGAWISYYSVVPTLSAASSGTTVTAPSASANITELFTAPNLGAITLGYPTSSTHLTGSQANTVLASIYTAVNTYFSAINA